MGNCSIPTADTFDGDTDVLLLHENSPMHMRANATHALEENRLEKMMGWILGEYLMAASSLFFSQVLPEIGGYLELRYNQASGMST